MSAPGPQRSQADNAGWLMLDRAVRLTLVFVTSLAIARHLGPERFGLLSYSVALAALVMEFTGLGLHGLVVRYLVEHPGRERRILGTVVGMRLGAGAFGVALAGAIAVALKPDPEVPLLVVLVAAGFGCRAFDAVDDWLQSHEQARQGAMVRSAVLLLVSVARLALVAAGAGVLAFALMTGLEYALVGLTLVALYWRREAPPWQWRPDAALGRELLAKSWPLILSSLGVIIYLKIDQIMLGQMIDSEAVGIYAVAAQLSEAGWFIPTALVTAAFPQLIKLHQDDDASYQARLQRLYDLLFGLGLLLAILVAAVGPWAVELLFGPAYAPAGGLLVIHIWSAVFIFMRAAFSRWLIVEELFIFSLVTHGLGALVNVGLNLVLIPRYGTTGAAIATVVAYATASYLALWAHPKTWPAARMMSLAMLAPVRWPLKLLRRR